MITILCANAGIDKTYEVPNFAAGGYYHPSSTSTAAGGKGINVARVIAALGHPGVIVGFAGGNNGRFINSNLVDAGLNTDMVTIAEESRVTINIIDEAQRTQTRVDEVGPLVTPTEVRRLTGKWSTQLSRSSLGIISGSAPRGVNRELYAEMIEIGRSMKKPVILDARDALLAHAVEARPTVITPNISELQRIVRRELSVPDGVVAAATGLIEQGVKVVLVTLGARGAIGMAGSRDIWWARPPKIDRISSVGSGDAFAAGFAIASIERRPFPERLRLAVAAGAANAETVGAGLITAERVRELEPEVQLERIGGGYDEDAGQPSQ